MNIYHVYRGPNPEVVEADIVTIEGGSGASFWRYKEKTLPSGRSLRQEKVLVAFYADVDKITQPETKAAEKYGENEKTYLIDLISRARRLASQYTRMTPNQMENAMRAFQRDVDALKNLENRLVASEPEEDDDDDI